MSQGERVSGSGNQLDEQMVRGIPPYRMNQIVKTAADMTERLVSGRNLYNPTYHECEIVLELVSDAVKKCKNEYRRK